ncbi:MAG TPA: response regulator [Candidatus Omnitrophota bacterium]|nr:response regulator [Candidatus Omnitrophota bacterium]HRZ14386.1 response regulator [Candidatus Omnitrophota bacterium]
MAKKILIADDEEQILDVLSRRLIKENFEVCAVSKGKEVLAETARFRPDLIIQDIVMSDTDGFTVAMAIRDDETLQSIPIIFMTGKDLTYDAMVKKVGSMAFCDFVIKPCTFEELLEKVRKALG